MPAGYPKSPWDAAAAQPFYPARLPRCFLARSPGAPRRHPHRDSAGVRRCPAFSGCSQCWMTACQTCMCARNNRRGDWRDQQTRTDGPRPTDRLGRDTLQGKTQIKPGVLLLTVSLPWRPAFVRLVVVGWKTIKDVIEKSPKGCRWEET